MTIEQELKELILSRYKSVRDFSISIEMPYSTIDSIFKRGVANASITNIIKICETLFISADDLARGKIVHRNDKAAPAPSCNELSEDEQRLIDGYRQLSGQGKEYMLQTLSMAVNQYKKHNSVSDMEASGL